MADPEPYATAAEIIARVAPTVLEATNTQLAANVAEFEEICEDYLGRAFAIRTATHKVTLAGGPVILPRSDAIAVTAITYETGTAPAVNTTLIDDGFSLILLPRGTAWPYGTRATFTYTYGTSTVPAVVKQAAIGYAVNVAKTDNSGQSRDVLTMAFDGGTTRYATPNRDEGRPTGWLDVDRRLNTIRGTRAPFVA